MVPRHFEGMYEEAGSRRPLAQWRYVRPSAMVGSVSTRYCRRAQPVTRWTVAGVGACGTGELRHAAAQRQQLLRAP